MKSAIGYDLFIPGAAWRRGQFRWVMQDLAGTARQPEHDPRTHLRAVFEWLWRAQDASLVGTSETGETALCAECVSAGWTFDAGWLPTSLNTTGRLVESYVPAARYLAWPALETRARSMVHALLKPSDEPSAGQIHGLIAGELQLGMEGCLSHAVNQAYALLDWPVTSTLHRAERAHAMAALALASQDAGLRRAAENDLNDLLSRQTPCGWFAEAGDHTATSTLAGILRSLIELSILLDDTHANQAALRVAHGFCNTLHREGWLVGAYDDGWMPATRHASLTGLVQVAGGWLRLSQVSSGVPWRDAAGRALSWVKRNQRIEGSDLALRAALPNSVPIWGGPGAFGFDAMNAKYFVDALMMDMVGISIPPLARRMEPV